MISKEDLKLFFEYNDFGYNGRYIPKKYAAFSNSTEFIFLDDLFQRLLLERQTKVAKAFKIETIALMSKELDDELIISLRSYVETYQW